MRLRLVLPTPEVEAAGPQSVTVGCHPDAENVGSLGGRVMPAQSIRQEVPAGTTGGCFIKGGPCGGSRDRMRQMREKPLML